MEHIWLYETGCPGSNHLSMSVSASDYIQLYSNSVHASIWDLTTGTQEVPLKSPGKKIATIFHNHVFFPADLLRYNWQITLCKFMVSNVMII